MVSPSREKRRGPSLREATGKSHGVPRWQLVSAGLTGWHHYVGPLTRGPPRDGLNDRELTQRKHSPVGPRAEGWHCCCVPLVFDRGVTNPGDCLPAPRTGGSGSHWVHEPGTD